MHTTSGFKADADRLERLFEQTRGDSEMRLKVFLPPPAIRGKTSFEGSLDFSKCQTLPELGDLLRKAFGPGDHEIRFEGPRPNGGRAYVGGCRVTV